MSGSCDVKNVDNGKCSDFNTVDVALTNQPNNMKKSILWEKKEKKNICEIPRYISVKIFKLMCKLIWPLVIGLVSLLIQIKVHFRLGC